MKTIIKTITTGMILSASLLTAKAEKPEGIRLDHLGVNNTLVRINGSDARYILFPVQESNEDARINVLVDGKLAETIYVRLAKTKTDFDVPFDLTPYKGKEVIFDVITPQPNPALHTGSGEIAWKDIKLSDNYDTTNREQFRPAYHHTPLYGWMNDPNGMFYKDGKWHLYYQWNPYGSKWQNMTWGHSVSDDLINWQSLPAAIRPDGLGSIFSGSAVIDTDNTAGFGKDALIAIYTSAGTNQMQSIASSHDNGTTFTTYAGNPVLTLPSEARDPKVSWNPKTGEWNLILAHALEHEMLIFTSPDLKEWTLASSFGKGLGAQNGVWECPDLFELPVKDSKGNTIGKKWMLICNINPDGPFGGSGTQYFIGDFDGKKFVVDTDANGAVPTKWMDYGKDHYATVTWSEAPKNRRTAIGWMSNWQYADAVPTQQFRSANTLPRDLYLFKGDNGQIYAASEPSPEVNALRGDVIAKAGKTRLSATPLNVSLPTDGLCETELSFEAKKGSVVNITFSNSKNEEIVISYNTDSHQLSFDRTKSGIIDFSNDFPGVTVSPTHEKDGKITLRIFVDRSSFEVFGNDGRFVMTNLVFPNEPYTNLAVSAPEGTGTLISLKVFDLKTK